MLELLKNRLPDGLCVSKVKGGARARQLQVWFEYDGTEVMGYLPTACAPGYEEHVCDVTICSAMMKVCLAQTDVEMVKEWDRKMNGLCEQD